MGDAEWWAYLQGVTDALVLSMPHGATPFQVLDAAMRAQLKAAPDDLQRRLDLALVWTEQHPEFKPTKRQRVSFTEDWGVGWPIGGGEVVEGVPRCSGQLVSRKGQAPVAPL